MFRVQNNVPDVYVNESRDFQILCRLIDCCYGAVKYSIDSIINIFDTINCSDRLLELLATRVGFFPKIQLDSNVLRYIIASFPYIINNKGTEAGVRAAIYAIMKAENLPGALETVRVEFINKDGNNQIYTVRIFTQNKIYNKAALREVMKYVLPFGYLYTLNNYSTVSGSTDRVGVYSDVRVAKMLSQRSGVHNKTDKRQIFGNRVVGTYNTETVVSSNDIIEQNIGSFPNNKGDIDEFAKRFDDSGLKGESE